jgi:hypothetical protein
MGNSEPTEALLRVERGRASEEELAALTVVLLALRSDGDDAGPDERRPVAGSRWWRRRGDYNAPRSWQ